MFPIARRRDIVLLWTLSLIIVCGVLNILSIKENLYQPLFRTEIEQKAAIPHNHAVLVKQQDDNNKRLNRTLEISHLAIYWVNSTLSQEQQKSIEASTKKKLFTTEYEFLDLNHTWVPAVDIKATRQMQQKGMLTMEGVKLKSTRIFDKKVLYKNHLNNVYEYHEAATLLSHLTAIKQAYNYGHDRVLFLEDDAVLTKDFFLFWESQVNLAPRGWSALQWYTSNEVIQKHSSSLLDPWITWQPEHWSSKAYMLNRKGMRSILEQIHSIDKSTMKGMDLWNLKKPSILLADEVIFHNAKRSYTSTYQWHDKEMGKDNGKVSASPSNTSSHIGTEDRILPSRSFPSRPESILAIMIARMKSAESIRPEIDRLHRDVDALCSIHTSAPCDWHVYVVLTKSALVDVFEKASAGMPPNIHFHLEISSAPFIKFRYVKEAIPEMDKYDYVLFKDNDQHLAGIPWATFMDRKGNSIISQPLRQTQGHSFLRKMKQPYTSGWWWFTEAKEWKFSHLKTSDWFTSVRGVPASFLEMYFVLFRADFAKEFFSRVLMPEYINSTAAGGIDYAWCGAAKELRPNQTSCMIVPVVSLHEDSKQIGKDKKFIAATQKSMDWFAKMFPSWCWNSYKSRGTISHPRPTNVEAMCKKLLGPDRDFDLSECFQEVERRAEAERVQ